MIEIKKLKFGYRKNQNVLDGVDLSLEPGRIVGLLGKNGVGKTTLMQLMSGVLFPTQGTVTVLGMEPRKREAECLSQLFMLPEEMPEVHLSIDKYMKINAPFYPDFSETDFVEYLREWEITDLRQSLAKLSLGTRKKVFIAFAFAANTPLLVLDEPTNGLDIPSKTVLRKLLRIKASENRLIVVSTHQVRDLKNILDAVVILDNTHVLLNADVERICDKLYFGIADGSENPDEVLYSEPSLAGTQVVRPNRGGEECDVDVELLFNAAFNAKQKITELFNK